MANTIVERAQCLHSVVYDSAYELDSDPFLLRSTIAVTSAHQDSIYDVVIIGQKSVAKSGQNVGQMLQARTYPLLFPPRYAIVPGMFEIVRQTTGERGSFVRLIRLESEDYTVIVRIPEDGRLHHRYMGPDIAKAEEVFNQEMAKLVAPRQSA